MIDRLPPMDAVGVVLQRARQAAVDYYRLTGKPLGIKLLKPGALSAAMTGSASLLAALAPGAQLLLLLALAAEQRLRQHGPGRAELRKLGF